MAGFRTAGFPNLTFNPMGFKANLGSLIPFRSDVLQYTKAPATDGILRDRKPGVTTGIPDGRTQPETNVLDGDGTRKLRFTYISTALTYVDYTTGLTENGTTDTNGDFLIPTNGVASLTIDGYTFYFEGGNQDIKCAGHNSSGQTIYGEIQNSTSSDRIQSDAVESNQDLVGYTESDGATYFYDESLTQLVPSGKRIVNVNGICPWYTASGKIDSQFTGELRGDIQVVDGVVNNGVDYGNWDLSGDALVGENGFIGTYTAQRPVWELNDILDNLQATLKEDTQYTIIINATINTCDQPLRLGTGIDKVISTGDTLLPANTDGEIRTLVTTVSSITSSNDNLFVVHNSNTTGQIQATFAMYEGDYVTGSPDLPESQQPVSGNSIYQLTKKYSLTQAQADITTPFYDLTDPDNVVINTVPVDDLLNIVDSNRLFISNPWIQVWYDREILNEYPDSELADVGKFMKLNETAIDSNGNTVVDVNGVIAYAWKSEVTIK